MYHKRVIGLPGEQLRCQEGTIYINGNAVETPAVISGRLTSQGIPDRHICFKDGDLIELAIDKYFVIGDNVQNSYDSRYHGPIKASSLVGVIDLIY